MLLVVDWIFFRCWSRWPLAVAREAGVYFLISVAVRPGNMTRKLLLMALRSVEVGGLKSAPWINARVSEMVPDGRTSLAVKIVSSLVVLNSWTIAAVG